jgi:(p)ppGpp synthase/HD superfamily hydrolase
MSPPLAMVRLKERNLKVSEQTSTPKLTGQFSKALVYAELKHHNQVRKGGDIPYVGHLLTVAGLVINDGGSEAQAIAALLHDAVEDQGGPVARIVDECSDTDAEPKPPWLERKQRYIDHLAEVGEDTLLVSVADKLDNARSVLRDYHEHGPSLWQRFNRKNPHDHLWYYGELLKAYRARGCRSWMVEELDRVVEELKRLVEGGDRIVLV